ncbi:NERD domain-containing protein [Halobacillus rhizosphaerae]|uniref:NERD domain-containing protein n=1 Tax=Halobacillus rhizosphaerae TaxID=3064889 RepID=UPI00398B1179
MAQLIKLFDYISRYETNIYQYPSQYIRLKRENWKNMHQMWKQGSLNKQVEIDEPEDESSGWKRLFNRKKNKASEHPEESTARVMEKPPESLIELKQYFLDGLLPFQLKWASTTLLHKSFVDKLYYQDARLKYFLQRFPDTYLLMYEAVVEMKKAKMDAETILVGPLGIEIIHYLDLPDADAVIPSDHNNWYVQRGKVQEKLLSPMIALNRTETFVKSVLSKYGIDFPYHKVVLAPKLTFQEAQVPFHTTYIDQTLYSQWLYDKRNTASPLKHSQLKAAEALLQHSRSHSIKRPEWDKEDDTEAMEE